MAGSDLPKVVKPLFSGRRLPKRGDNPVVRLRVGSAMWDHSDIGVVRL